MYYINKEKAKIGKITVEKFRESYRLRFTHPQGQRHQLVVAPATDEGWAHALKKAHQIQSDILNNNFDFSYVRYCPERAQTIEILENIDIKKVWEEYKEKSKNRVQRTTQKDNWKITDNALACQRQI